MRFTSALTAAAALLALTACQQKKPEGGATQGGVSGAPAVGDVILLGHIGSMTGNEATFGDSSDKGIRLAVDEVNAAGGVKGRKLEVVVFDTLGKPEEAAISATRAINEKKATSRIVAMSFCEPRSWTRVLSS